MPDPQRGSPEDRELRHAFRAMEARRAQTYAGLDALLAGRERELHQDYLATYTARRIEEEAEPRPGHVGIAPELRDLIGGSTRAEVEMSIQRMVTKTSEILAGLRIAGLVEEEPPAAPEPSGQLGPEEIARLPLGSPEHMALRREHGISQPFVL